MKGQSTHLYIFIHRKITVLSHVYSHLIEFLVKPSAVQKYCFCSGTCSLSKALVLENSSCYRKHASSSNPSSVHK